MGEFPSGQRGQTVNLLSTTSVVRIHSPPPKSEKPHNCAVSLLFLEVDGLALRRFSTVLPCFCAVCVLHIFLNIVDVFSSSCLAWLRRLFVLTHTVTHTRKRPEITGECRMCFDPHPGLACRLGRFAACLPLADAHPTRGNNRKRLDTSG